MSLFIDIKRFFLILARKEGAGSDKGLFILSW